MELKNLRISKNLTQKECARFLNIPLRTYINYENDISKKDSIKYRYMLSQLSKYGVVDEEHGILSTERIRLVCSEVLSEYSVDYCYLFGSYAKGCPGENSDVDLLISSKASGIVFFQICEELRSALGKKVDLLDVSQLNDNPGLLNEILKYGVKIYG